jgi:hypothetical protein
VPKPAIAIAIQDDGERRALSDVDDPPFDWTNIVDDALAKFPTIALVDVDSAEVSVRVSVNSFRAQIVAGRLFIKAGSGACLSCSCLPRHPPHMVLAFAKSSTTLCTGARRVIQPGCHYPIRSNP